MNPTFHQHTKEEPICVIWDCDGTLIDTEKQSSDIIAEIMEQAKPGSREIEYQTHSSIIGLPTEQWVAKMIQVAHLEEYIDPSDFAKKYIEGMSLASPSFKKMRGAESLTRFFAERGVPQYMATSTPRDLIGSKLAPHSNMINRFDGIVTSDDVEHGKPAPDIFLKAAEMAGVPPSHCIVFEDSPFGVKGGLDGGMNVVALPYPGSDLSLFDGACQIVNDLSEFDSIPFGFDKYVCDEV